jgi:hypothetical protein
LRLVPWEGTGFFRGRLRRLIDPFHSVPDLHLRGFRLGGRLGQRRFGRDPQSRHGTGRMEEPVSQAVSNQLV